MIENKKDTELSEAYSLGYKKGLQDLLNAIETEHLSFLESNPIINDMINLLKIQKELESRS